MFIKVASSAFAGAGFDYLDYSDNGISLEIGDLVVVPFNKSLVTGFVINKSNKSEAPNVLPVREKIDGGNKLTSELIDLAFFVSRTYFCPLSRVILSVIPSVLTNKVKQYYSITKREEFETPKEIEILERIENSQGFIGKLDDSEKRVLRSLIKKGVLVKNFKLESPKVSPKMIRVVKLTGVTLLKPTPKQQALVDFLKEKDDYIPTSYITKNNISTMNVINALIEKKVLKYEDVREDRVPSWTYIAPSNVTFTAGQQEAFETISSSISENKRENYLLFGVTASGKTEVYIKLIEEVIKQGKCACVLLPEIALTNQIMNIFKSRFGKLVAVLHSNLSNGERLDEWDRIRDGKAKIVLGARSAVFAPLKNIGLIVIDEEHDGGYKQDTLPKYNTRDVALYRADKNKAICVFGSATPSVESYYKAKTGEYKLLVLPERVPGRRLPTVYMTDLKDKSFVEKKVSQGDGGLTNNILSPLLFEKIKDRLSKNEQIILLQNRRAYFTYIMCPDCGWVAKCPNCDVSLKYHYKTDILLCHHCGYMASKPEDCPECHNRYIKAFGTGTQKVEDIIKNSFPEARVLRMDKDTTQGKSAIQEILNTFRNKEADILVGTQMIAKGLDFPGVTLVGVINADIDLNMPDFRSGERTFQLLNQVTGRAGRGDIEGEVVIQTYNPENEILKFAKSQDYEGFFESEISNRKALNYPPFIRIIKASVQGEKFQEIEELIDKFKGDLDHINTDKGKMIVYPPLPAVVPKINNIYKVNMLIKTFDMEYTKDRVLSLLKTKQIYKRRISFDIDPMFMD